jgi:hypothetical protein
MYKTTIAAALIIAALGGGVTAVNAASSHAVIRDDRVATHRSVPAQYSQPPWIKRHARSESIMAT